MYLHAEVLARVDELDEQGELVAKLLIHLLPHQQSLVLVDELRQRQALVNVVHQSTIDGYALMTRHTTDFPTLTDVRLGGINALKRCYLVATPDGGLQIRFEFVWFHIQ